PQVLVHEASSSWRSSLSADVYGPLSRHYGPTEMERQELIYSLSASEEAFVKSSRRVIRTIFLPLRGRESRAWLPGLPTEMGRFFDWLEDIVNLHVLISRALSTVSAIWQAGSIVQRVAGTLKGFVPRLEVYMPYLAKYEGVKEVVRWHAERDEGEFGEYLRMKERERGEGEWSLERMLEEPVTRLSGYLDLFQVRALTVLGRVTSLIISRLIASPRANPARASRSLGDAVSAILGPNCSEGYGRSQGA
ncbi:Dbl homology domain-containing protein, partial [Trametes gibbosa]